MAGRIPKSFIEDLVGRADIVEIIGRRIALKKAGRMYKACCPFHNEKTPSFTVTPERQTFHCFGCGMHGNAVGFIMEHDRLSYPEAVEELAAQMGLEVPREADARNPAEKAASEDLFALNAKAAQCYREWLKEDVRAIEYLKGRGLTGETAGHFAIGYAPNSWNALLKKLAPGSGAAADEARSDLSDAGLIVERGSGRATGDDSGHYDRFRDRIMFPIRDARGRVLGFGGRILDKGEPKYMNSPETAIFHKGRELYGLYEVRRANRLLPRLLIVEGYMDVVRLHQAGITYAAATLGTATTADHLERVFRLTAEVVFGFDGDNAGRKAAWRALENCLPQAREGRQIKFLFLPEGQDPDSMVGEEGREKFEARIEAAIPLSTYLIETLASQSDLSHVDGRAKLAKEAQPLLEKIPAGVYRELLIDQLAKKVGMPAARLASFLKEPDSAPAQSTRRAASSSARVSAGRGSLVRQAITLLLNHPGAAEQVQGIEQLDGIGQPGVPLLAELLRDLRERPAKTKAVVIERWRDRPEGVHLEKLAVVDSPLEDTRAAAQDLQRCLQAIIDKGTLSRRTGELIEKDGLLPLSRQELIELNELLKARGPHATKKTKA